MGKIEQIPSAIPPAPAVMAILDRFNREELGNTIEVLIALLDIWDGDPDAESGNDVEDDFTLTANAIERATKDVAVDSVDQDEAAWIEWHTLRGKKGGCISAGHEDDEDDDPREDNGDTEPNGDEGDFTMAEDEPVSARAVLDRGAGCPISDPGELWQCTFNVPVDPVISADHNIFNDKRVPLGYSNLMTSFVSGKEVRSADTGNVHSGLNLELKPGVPV